MDVVVRGSLLTHLSNSRVTIDTFFIAEVFAGKAMALHAQIQLLARDLEKVGCPLHLPAGSTQCRG